MPKKTILVVDDEPDLRDLLRINLIKEGYEVLTAADGQSALELVARKLPDLVLLDIMLPGIDGYEVCTQIKRDPELKQTAVIILSAKNDEVDQVVGLKLGADDYIAKPFSPKVLIAKLDAFFRNSDNRNEQTTSSPDVIIDIDHLKMNSSSYTASYKGTPLNLTAIEYKILYFLAKKPGRVYSRDQIIEQARGDDVIISGRTVDVHILSIRRKVGFSDIVETVRGIGYKFHRS
jgi:DNA-binding response OmpR family regulator